MQTKLVKSEPNSLNNQEKEMKIWAFSIDMVNFSEYGLPRPEDSEFFEQTCVPQIIQGKSIGDLWKPLVFIAKTRKKNTDFVYIQDRGIAMSERALKVLHPLLQNSIEAFPLMTLPENPFYFVNAISLDALNQEKSIFEYSSVSKTKIGIEKLAFKPDVIKERHFFKLKDFWYRRCVSEEFRILYKEHDLQGLDFSNSNLLWVKKDTQ